MATKTPEQELGIEDLIAEAEFFFGSSGKSKKGSSKSSSHTKSGSGKSSSSSDASKKKPASPGASKKKPAASDTPKKKPKAPSDASKKKPAASDMPKKKSKTPPDTTKKKPDSSGKKPKHAAPRLENIKSLFPMPPKRPKPLPLHKRILASFRRLPKWVLYVPLLLLCGLLVFMSISANTIQLKSAEVTVTDLPYSFRGTRVLYLSDLHINSLNSVDKVNTLIDEIMQLEPDLLLLGGDYTSADPLMYLKTTLMSGTASVEGDMRELFFENLAQYNPPLGKFAVAGENDNRLDSYPNVCFLEAAMKKGGVTLLRNEIARIRKDGQSIIIAGIDDWEKGERELYQWDDLLAARDCVIVLCHDPESIPLLNSYPVSGGFWIDLALCGHTHGGTVSVNGFELLNPTSDRTRFSSGWHRENAAKMLISRGVGGGILPLRLGAAPEVHLLTLK